MKVAGKKVLMFVLNELIYDARVLKSANSLSGEYDVVLVGIWRRKFDLDQEAEIKKWPFVLTWVDLGWTSKTPNNYFGHGLRYIKVFLGVLSVAWKFKPDIVHAHEVGALPIGRAIQVFLKARLVYDAHELYRDSLIFSSAVRKFLGRLETHFMKSCDAIIACNHPRAAIMHAEYGAPFLPAVVPNISRYMAYKPTTNLQEKLKTAVLGISRLVLYQGAIIPGRGLEMTPHALSLLPENFGMALMGGGVPAYKSILMNLAVELGVGNRFFILPPVLQTQLFPFTCSADVGMVIYQNTCRNNYYCAPNKLYEYAAAGVPMVGTDFPTIRGFIESQNVGTLFHPESPEDLARAISEVCRSEATYAGMFESCLKTAEQFTWENVSQKELLALYGNIRAFGKQYPPGN